MENAEQNAEQKPADKGKGYKEYKRKLFWRKARLYILMLLTFALCLYMTVSLFYKRFETRTYPQINRAVSQISQLLPQLQENETIVRTVYELMEQSREMLTGEKADKTDSGIDPAVLESLSWMNRISKLKVGYDGSVVVVSKEDGTILAHPDDQYVGQKMLVFTMGYKEKQFGDGFFLNVSKYNGLTDVELEDFSWKEGEDLRMPIRAFMPSGWKYSDMLEGVLNASVVSYGDTYIIVGVGMPEFFSYIYYALLISVIVLILLWLFVKYICLHMDRRELRGKQLRTKLTAYGVILSVVILLVSWYVQVLYDVSIDLKTMGHHAKVAVDTMDTFKDTQKRIISWLDSQYLEQCRAAGEYLKQTDRESLTRQKMAELGEVLGVEYVSLFDKNGKVIITNSPYDHFILSIDPAKPSYSFRALLQGVDSLVQEPMPDELSGQTMQYIGVSLRDENDLSDGFVQIALTTELRDMLTTPLDVQKVLDMLVIGLPEHAVAIDRETMLLAATTGVGYVGETAEDFGIKKENLQDSYSGFLNFNGNTYYAGFGETEDYYLVPVVQRTREADTFIIALKIALLCLAALVLIIVLALFRYDQNVIDNYTEPEAKPEKKESKILSGWSSVFTVQEKWNFSKRWRINIPKEQQTPEERIAQLLRRLLMIVCLLTLIPYLIAEFYNVKDTSGMVGLSYVLSGNWEKGVNIFAFTACVFLALVLFIFSTLVDRVLYHIARVSDMRVETICLLLRSSLRYVVVIAFIYYGLSQFGIPSQALLASAGIVTLAISVGAKDFINDIIAGFFILIEGNFKVGDFVTIGSWYGFVEVIGIRTTKVGFRGETKIFNNSSIREVINCVGPTNLTTVKVPISLTENLENVEAILKAELPKLLEQIPVLAAAPYYDGVSDWTTDAIIIRVRAKTEQGRHYKAGRMLKRHLKLIFDSHGIKVPYQQVDVHMPPDEENSLPSAESAGPDETTSH